jgi:hypothetical protein
MANTQKVTVAGLIQKSIGDVLRGDEHFITFNTRKLRT